jgi:predicted  nucleic acid-binding Zn-ribbon protein
MSEHDKSLEDSPENNDYTKGGYVAKYLPDDERTKRWSKMTKSKLLQELQIFYDQAYFMHERYRRYERLCEGYQQPFSEDEVKAHLKLPKAKLADLYQRTVQRYDETRKEYHQTRAQLMTLRMDTREQLEDRVEQLEARNKKLYERVREIRGEHRKLEGETMLSRENTERQVRKNQVVATLAQQLVAVARASATDSQFNPVGSTDENFDKRLREALDPDDGYSYPY